MIAAVMLNTNPGEASAIETALRNLVARLTDEAMELSILPGGASLPARCVLIHLAILDITAPGGLEIAKLVRKKHQKAEILVLADGTVSPMLYLHPSIRASALLLRPFTGEQMKTVLGDFFRAFAEQLPGKKEDKIFLARNKDGITRIPVNQIYYFEAREKKIFVRMKHKEFGVSGTIEKLGEELEEDFVRCHRSYLVNRSMIQQVKLSENVIYLKDGVNVPVSRSYKSSIKEYLYGTDLA